MANTKKVKLLLLLREIKCVLNGQLTKSLQELKSRNDPESQMGYDLNVTLGPDVNVLYGS